MLIASWINIRLGLFAEGGFGFSRLGCWIWIFEEGLGVKGFRFCIFGIFRALVALRTNCRQPRVFISTIGLDSKVITLFYILYSLLCKKAPVSYFLLKLYSSPQGTMHATYWLNGHFTHAPYRTEISFVSIYLEILLGKVRSVHIFWNHLNFSYFMFN